MTLTFKIQRECWGGGVAFSPPASLPDNITGCTKTFSLSGNILKVLLLKGNSNCIFVINNIKYLIMYKIKQLLDYYH